MPGGTALASTLHSARTVCRRAERLVVSAHGVTDLNMHVLEFLNRLSDLPLRTGTMGQPIGRRNGNTVGRVVQHAHSKVTPG